MPGWLVALLLVAAAVALSRGAAARGRGALPPAVLVAGDSLAQGLGPALQRALAPRGIAVFTVGVQGSSARDWRREFLARALGASPAPLVFMSLGTNDAASPVLAAEFAGNVQRIAERIAPRRAVWLIPPKRSGAVDAVLERPEFDSLAPPAGLRLDATGHPLGDGYDRWADSVVASFPS